MRGKARLLFLILFALLFITTVSATEHTEGGLLSGILGEEGILGRIFTIFEDDYVQYAMALFSITFIVSNFSFLYFLPTSIFSVSNVS